MAVLVLLFIVVPILEIYVIIQVGQAIGALWTIALLIADSIIGARLLGWQGRAAWRRFQEALSAGRVPHSEVLDGAMILIGGTLLLTPGFITDVVGLALLLPPTRAFIRRGVVRALRRPGLLTRVVVFRPGSPPPRGPQDPPRPDSDPHPPRLGSPESQQPNRELPGG